MQGSGDPVGPGAIRATREFAHFLGTETSVGRMGASFALAIEWRDDVGYSFTVNTGAVPLPAPLAALPPKAITRSFDSLSQATAEAASARVFAGIHFRSGCVQGVRQGTKVGRFAILHYLRPLK